MPRDARADGREASAHRDVEIVPGFHRNAEGSVLYRAGGTVVLCTASIEDGIPKWMNDGDGGWLTAEYQMHPRANPARRENREGRGRQPGGRTLEIQRLVGRALRSSIDLKKLGPRTITIDCDVLEADGGTRTASVTAGFVSTALALYGMGLAGLFRDQVAAISVGHVGGGVLVDLNYQEDVAARVDMNVVATHRGNLVEVQGTAEGVAIERSDFDGMVDSAITAIHSLCEIQRKALHAADVDLRVLMKRD
jgi:ribonuclease PH